MKGYGGYVAKLTGTIWTTRMRFFSPLEHSLPWLAKQGVKMNLTASALAGKSIATGGPRFAGYHWTTRCFLWLRSSSHLVLRARSLHIFLQLGLVGAVRAGP